MKEELLEIRWHGRGGQGAVTAARILAKAVVADGKYAQAFSEFGPERRGAPVRAFTRISPSFFRGFYGITRPHIVMVLDDRLLETVDVTEGLLPEGMVVVNTVHDVRTALRKTPEIQISTVDASGIARECTGHPIPNAPMLGALVKVKPVIELRTLIESFRASLEGKFSAEVIKTNITAIRRAYEEVKRA